MDRRPGQRNKVRHTENWGAGGRNDLNARFFKDPDHGWDGGRYQRNGGKLDQWLGPGTGNDEFALSTYNARDLPIWAQLTRGWQTYDRWFCSLLGPTQPNRYYLYSGQSAGLKDNTLPPLLANKHPNWLAGFDWATVWDLCSNGGVTTSYFFSNLPETAFWGHRHLHRTHHVSEYFAQCRAGHTAPGVDHRPVVHRAQRDRQRRPPARRHPPRAAVPLRRHRSLRDLTPLPRGRAGHHLRRVGWLLGPRPTTTRVTDDRGTDRDPGGKDDFAQLGFRIPSTIISPWTRHHQVDHTVYNHASILRFVSDNWGMPYLTKRVKHSNSLASAFRRFTAFDPHHDLVPYRIAPDVQLQMVLDATVDQLKQGHIPAVIPSKAPVDPPMSDLHRLAETGWFDHLKVNIDHRFEDGFLRPSDILEALSAKADAEPLTPTRRSAQRLRRKIRRTLSIGRAAAWSRSRATSAITSAPIELMKSSASSSTPATEPSSRSRASPGSSGVGGVTREPWLQFTSASRRVKLGQFSGQRHGASGARSRSHFRTVSPLP